MKAGNYKNIWLIFVNIKAKPGFVFNDLVNAEGADLNNVFTGAWANVLVKAVTISEAIETIPGGLGELNFETVFIDKAENVMSLIEYKELNEGMIKEADWLLNSGFIFKISDKIFPYII